MKQGSWTDSIPLDELPLPRDRMMRAQVKAETAIPGINSYWIEVRDTVENFDRYFREIGRTLGREVS